MSQVFSFLTFFAGIKISGRRIVAGIGVPALQRGLIR